ncbi:MAG: hypothetical protein GMKNLPBB_00672 [Myxococcota bacterium]|nr:hypothetical protein [Myxococcota bacterium]
MNMTRPFAGVSLLICLFAVSALFAGCKKSPENTPAVDLPVPPPPPPPPPPAATAGSATAAAPGPGGDNPVAAPATPDEAMREFYLKKIPKEDPGAAQIPRGAKVLLSFDSLEEFTEISVREKGEFTVQKPSTLNSTQKLEDKNVMKVQATFGSDAFATWIDNHLQDSARDWSGYNDITFVLKAGDEKAIVFASLCVMPKGKQQSYCSSINEYILASPHWVQYRIPLNSLKDEKGVSITRADLKNISNWRLDMNRPAFNKQLQSKVFYVDSVYLNP